MKQPLSIYLHIPFCRTRCAYCDFTTTAGMTQHIPRYCDALIQEINASAHFIPAEQYVVHTVYFGGGTPSLLPADTIRAILASIRDHYPLHAEPEITLEMNPGDVTPETAAQLVDAGVNRASLGMQSAHDDELRRMNRRHSMADTRQAVATLRNAGVTNLSLDLIYGYPGQTPQQCLDSLTQALALEPQHLSLYALSVEPNAPLQKQIQQGKVQPLEDDFIADLYDLAREKLAAAGMIHYEISNWSRTRSTESRHNNQYWLMEPYLGFGAGAHAYFDHQRTRNPDDIQAYIDRLTRSLPLSKNRIPAAEEVTDQSERMEMDDWVTLGLRLLDRGIDPAAFEKRFGKKLAEVYAKPLAKTLQRGWLTADASGILRLNADFAFVSNQIFVEFM